MGPVTMGLGVVSGQFDVSFESQFGISLESVWDPSAEWITKGTNVPSKAP